MYRNDIDGLRALAVLSVLAFHFGHIISGGFVGVDIFFVISGFLITGIIMRDLSQDKFSFLDFYKRRIKRILPALYTVLVSSVVAAYIFMPPFEMNDMAGGMIFAVLNASNLYFWKTADYFDVSVDYKPFLHTWSLSVEEQFYIFFPFLLWILYRYAKISLPKIIIFFVVCSFALSVYIQNDMPAANFYILPTRAWELGAGALLAIYATRPIENMNMRFLCGLFSMILMVVPIFTYHESMVFPGVTALPVVLGAVLFIWAGMKHQGQNHIIFNQIFTYKIPVFIGKISYSLYLWHWCVYVFCVLTLGKSGFSHGVMGVISFALAVMSYYIVESPLRHIKGGRAEKILLMTLLFISAGLIGFGLLIQKNQGFWNRFDESYHGAFSGQFNYDSDMKNCSENPSKILDIKHCLKGDVSKNDTDILIWGDSHGRSMLSGLIQQANLYQQNMLVRNVGGCVATTGDIYINRKTCQDYSHNMMSLIQNHKFKKVLLIGRWSLHYDGREFDKKIKFFDKNGQIPEDKITSAFEQDFKKMTDIITQTGAEIYILDTVPGYKIHIPELLLRGDMIGEMRKTELESQVTSRETYMQNNVGFRDFIHRLMLDNKNIIFLSASDMLCPASGTYCMYADKNGKSYYRDTNHLSEYGSQFISPVFAPLFQDKNKLHQNKSK